MTMSLLPSRMGLTSLAMSAPQNYVPGLKDILYTCYDENRLPDEREAEYLRPGRTVSTAEVTPFTLEE